MDGGEVWPGGDPLYRLDAVEHRHADVHQYHVRPAQLGDAHGLLPVGGLSYHLDVILGVEERGKPGPDQLLVVG